MKFIVKNWDLLLCLAIGCYFASKEDNISFFGIVGLGLFAGFFIYALYVVFRVFLNFDGAELPDPEEVRRKRKEFNKLDLGGYVSPKEDREFRKEQAEIKRRNRNTNSGFGGIGGL